MKKLYRVRLFRVMDKITSSKYEVCCFGTILVSTKKKDCREYFYELDIPVVDSELEHDAKNTIPMNLVTMSLEKEKKDYIVLSEDFKEKNLIKTKKDLLGFNFNPRTNYAMGIVERLKELEEFEKGVVYGKSIGRS